MKSQNCSSCGGTVEIYSFGKFLRCPYCGTQNLVNYKQSSWKSGNYSNTRECPVCREKGSLVLSKNEKLWKCLNCAYCIEPRQLRREIFWFCDSCDAFINVQPGFTQKLKEWKCMHCGFLNDTSSNNVLG